MTVRPRQCTEAQIPETAQTRQRVGSPGCPPSFNQKQDCSAEWAAQESIQIPQLTGLESGLHQNHTSPPLPVPHHGKLQAIGLKDYNASIPSIPRPLPQPRGSKFHYISQEGSLFFVSEHLAQETS